MGSRNRQSLTDRVIEAAQSALARQKRVCPLDVFLAIGWVDPNLLRRWQEGRIDCLEETIQTNPVRVAEALAILSGWASEQGLIVGTTTYVAKTPRRQSLRFSRNGDPALEHLFCTQWTSAALSQRQRERMSEKASKPPELVVIDARKEWTCHRCGGTGAYLMMEDGGPACLRCVKLDDLEYVPAGNALLTRRVKARSACYAVVVRFSKTRGRYERQGLLVEPRSLQEVERELTAQS